MDIPRFGKPWAARGETRKYKWRTPLAWVDGWGGGVLLVEGPHSRPWLMMSEWDAWVRESGAEPVPESDPDPDMDAPWAGEGEV